MENLENWKEVARGIYRYVIAAKACYEIHVCTHELSKDIMDSDCSLYLVGTWSFKDDRDDAFIREIIEEHKSLRECLKSAVYDNEVNNG